MTNKLPQIVNMPIELVFGEVKLQAKKATLQDFANLQAYSEKVLKDDTIPASLKDIKNMIYALKLCVQKAYPEEQVTEDYIMELLPLDWVLEHVVELRKALETLGFIQPQGEKKQ